MMSFVEWARGAGAMSVVVFIVLYAVATVFMVPGTLLTLGAGFVYGPVWGTALVSPASVLGASLAFWLARSVARPWISGRVEGDARFANIDRAVGAEGLKVVFLLRLSPVFPFTFLNYALGLTAVSFRKYVLASWLGMLPATFLYVYLGSLVPSVAELASGAPSESSGLERVLLWVGLAATVTVTIYLTRLAKKALDQTLPVDNAAAGTAR
ncbi:MAG: TVP38/TMEM64 family protein [Proteobacteria bacterium]|nr:TVP38/TMEM64 family protein [Pseudomonadota bacterium]